MWFRKANEKYTKPITLYHGTRNPDVDIHNLEEREPGIGGLGKGIYFGETPEVAQSYGDKVLKVPVNIKNPLVIDMYEDLNYRVDPEIADYYNDTGLYDSIIMGERVLPFDVFLNNEWVKIRDHWDLSSLKELAEEAGHDAIIARGIREKNGDEVVVFNKSQIMRL